MKLAVCSLLVAAVAVAVAVGADRDALFVQQPDSLYAPRPLASPLVPPLVSFDEHSLFVRGERVVILSGEFHPWRLPVPSLWLDIFQKIKALGFNCVSFYVNWALLEGTPGNFTATGVFDFDPFFRAAAEAGLYLIARPGPYINAEASFGGLPGWLQRNKGRLRTSDADFLAATDNYVANIGRIIANAQITNGGPVILYQPENEYSFGVPVLFPDGGYMEYVEQQARRAGIVVPLISNDAAPLGHNAPRSGRGAVDIYGHDSYPLGFDCSSPSSWPPVALPTYFHFLHQRQSPSTPFSLIEFQGGSFDPWGGPGFGSCAALLNHEFVRIFYKNNFAAGAAIFNVYMIYGGTNWGGIGYPGGYFSYDYGAAITEDGRTIDREKYSEIKLQANFLKVSPGYLLAKPGSLTAGVYSSSLAVTVTRLEGNNSGDFYVIRHADYTSQASTDYSLKLPIQARNLSIPLHNMTIPWFNTTVTTSVLRLNGRDSKMIVTNYDVHGTRILYSTAEIFTHHKFDNKTVLVVYSGGSSEINEMALVTAAPVTYHGNAKSFVNATFSNGIYNLSFATARGQTSIVEFRGFFVHIMDRNTAYRYWVTDVASASSPLLIKGPYLVRAAALDGAVLDIRADFNVSTTEVDILGVPPDTRVSVNGNEIADFQVTSSGSWQTAMTFTPPELSVPSLSRLQWKCLDSLPEIGADYDDSMWPAANQTSTNNSNSLQVPVSLYRSDYGFHSGILLFRGHFVAPFENTNLYLKTQGGKAYAWTVWMNGTLVYAWDGDPSTSWQDASLTSLGLKQGTNYVVTVMIDNMGYDENFFIGYDLGKAPRGILDFRLYSGILRRSHDVSWRITGNLGGENYRDRVRGPLNEGGLFVERQGLHQPRPPLQSQPGPASFEFADVSPMDGTASAGVAFYTAQLKLSLPADEWDIPLAFVFDRNTSDTSPTSRSHGYRAQLWINGWNFGRYLSSVGPQERFPVPEGILNYKGENWIGLAVWATHASGARVGLELSAGNPVRTGRKKVELVDSPAWSRREGAY